MVRAAVAVAALCAASLGAQSADSTRQRAGEILYQRLPYGSQAYFSPFTVLLNKGFDNLQAKNARRDVQNYPFNRAFRLVVFDALVNPGRAVERFPGWNAWLRTEIFPLSYSAGQSRWFVNYTEHMIGGGLTYRTLDEWYRVHGAPWPRALAAATTFTAAMFNEAVEHWDGSAASAASVADLWVFDLGGIALFSLDPMVEFFGGTLQAADWSNLASYTVPNHELRNTGQYMILKVPLPNTTTRLFLRGGMGVQFGLSRPVRQEHSLTVAVGLGTEARYVDPVTHDESIVLTVGGGVYWDRRNSLLASLNVGPSADRVTLNVYPGVLPKAGKDLGAWMALTREGQVIGGIVSRSALGLGLGFRR